MLQADAPANLSLESRFSCLRRCVPVGGAAWRTALSRAGLSTCLKLMLSLTTGHAPTAQNLCSIPPPVVVGAGVHAHSPSWQSPSPSRRASSPSRPSAPSSPPPQGPSGGRCAGGGSRSAREGNRTEAAAKQSESWAEAGSGPLLSLLHVLEGVAGGSAVAPLAEALLDGLVAAGGTDSNIAAQVGGVPCHLQNR